MYVAHVYFDHNHSNNRITGKLFNRRAHVPYIIALVVLWMSVTTSLLSFWVKDYRAFVVNDSSPISTMVMIEDFSNTFGVAALVVSYVVSNGILVNYHNCLSRNELTRVTQIWRCYVLWHTTWCLTALIPLLLASTGVFLSYPRNEIVDLGLRSACNLYFGLSTTPSYLLIGALALVLSAATTVSATLMIALKIILVTRRSHTPYSYRKVIEILVQSAALESLLQIFSAINAIVVYMLGDGNTDNPTLEVLVGTVLAYSTAVRLVVMVCVD